MTLYYQLDRPFKLWAYTVSHSSLLLRSELKYPDQDEYSDNTSYNIDMEFWAVTYINIPNFISNVIIREITYNELPTEIDRNLLIHEMKVYELESNKKKYYIIAGGILIGKNRWENQDRIFNAGIDLEHDEIIFCSI